jgi:Ca-activated chloride channel homolog
MNCKPRVALLTFLALVATGVSASPQSGRQSGSERGKEVLHIIVEGQGKGATIPLPRDAFELYDGGQSQTLETLTLDQTPARIVLLVDNTKTLKASVDDLKAAAHALVDELFEGDQMMVIGYDQSAYVLQDFTTRLDALDAAANDKFQKQGFPRLFDAISATILDAFGGVGAEKRAIVLVSDGYDNLSKEKFDGVIAALQRENIVVYVLQVPDRTRNASRIEGPKPQKAVETLTTATGGRVFPISEATTAAKLITEELRLNWYRAVYTPRGVDRLVERNVLLIKHDNSLVLRTKASFPGRKVRQT